MSTETPHGDLVLNPLALELDRVLNHLDLETGARLERTVRDAPVLAESRRKSPGGEDSLGYPAGYFETTAGRAAGSARRTSDADSRGLVMRYLLDTNTWIHYLKHPASPVESRL